MGRRPLRRYPIRRRNRPPQSDPRHRRYPPHAPRYPVADHRVSQPIRAARAITARQRPFRGIARQVRVRTIVGRVLCRVLQARRFEHLGKRYAGPLGTARAAVGPLIATGLRLEERPTVAAAFQNHAIGPRLEAALQLAKREFNLVVHLAINNQLPGVRIATALRDLAVVADEEFRRGCGLVIKKRLRGFGHERTVAEHYKTRVLAGKVEWLRAFWSPLGRLSRAWSALGER